MPGMPADHGKAAHVLPRTLTSAPGRLQENLELCPAQVAALVDLNSLAVAETRRLQALQLQLAHQLQVRCAC